MVEPKPNAAARALSKRGAAKGGRARASVLTPEERSDVARAAVRARWTKAGKVYPEESPESATAEPQALKGNTTPYSMFRGMLQIGDVEIECHVLSDQRRVLTQREVVRVLASGRESGNLNRYLERNPLYDESMLAGRTIQFDVPGAPQLATGYEATLLIEICEMYLDARAQHLLKRSQDHLAQASETIIRACAKVGIIALVDEATGFQQVRERQALQLKLQAFIADDMQEWARMFPPEFWFELARLEGVTYSPRSRPLRWGKYIMAFVYDAIDEDIGKALRARNPNPHFKENHHQWLKKYGRDKVHDQIERVITIMKLCQDMDDFRRKFATVFKKTPLQSSFDDLIIPD